MNHPSPLESIFFAALEKSSLQERAAYLDEACASDADLRRRVEKMLAAQAEASSFLERPAHSPVATIDRPASEVCGTTIGPYKLIEHIGEGGMGTVWMAQQTEPVKRLVAVKLIKAGMDSKQVIARFEAERQALALMDHANIARVLDAGVTGAGRPYFVMDLVKGVPITKYCDEHHLTPRQRLELFIPVCQAIQHAHQKGIIHRDLKPSNVLVALYDGKPVPKIIDFGVAKAAGQQLTDKTLVTGFGAIVGTLEYMSPEQAEVNQLDIDTRSDIYSLGVLLYELLAGSPPFSHHALQKAGMLEMLRVIREQEPSKPSTKLSTAEGLPTLAANRGTEPAKLTRLMRGELDWIVMKALEKDRNRRYETANAFALDVERYLNDEQVVACPPSASYRLRKFVRRNKAALGLSALVLFFLVLIGGTLGWAVRNRTAREADLAHEEALRRARLNLDIEHSLANAIKARHQALALLGDRYRWQAALAEAASDLNRCDGLASQVTNGIKSSILERLEETRQMLAADEADHRFSMRFEEIQLEQSEVNLEYSEFKTDVAFNALKDEFRCEYQIDFAQMPVETAASVIRQRPKPIQEILLTALEICTDEAPQDSRESGKWLKALLDTADDSPWRKRAQQAIQAKDWASVEQTVTEAAAARQPASMLLRVNRGITEPSVHRHIARLICRAYPGDFWANHDLASHLSNCSPLQLGEAARYYIAALALRPHNPAECVNLGNTLKDMGDVEGAISAYSEAVDRHPNYAAGHERLAFALRDKGDLDGCIAELREAIQYRTFLLDHIALADALAKKGLSDEVIAAYEGAINIDPKRAIGNRRGWGHDPGMAYLRLAAFLLHQMQPEQAATTFHRGAAPFHRGLESEGTNYRRWFFAAAFDAAAGEADEYRRTCRGMLQRFGDTTDSHEAERIARSCLLMPDALGAKDFDRVQELAERAVTGTELDRRFGMCAMAKGLADFRARRYADSLEWMKQVAGIPNDSEYHATKLILLAMVQHALGRTTEAATALANAKEILGKTRDPAKLSWDSLHAEVLYREAETLLRKAATETGPKGSENPQSQIEE